MATIDFAMKKLSIVTVTFNCAHSISKTLASVAAQNADVVEHIVIDGGSIDGTVEIINKYKEQLVYFVSEPDRGIYDAMNKGISAATGEWILFLNAGDVFHEKFELASLKFDWPSATEFVVFPYIIDGDANSKLPDLTVRFGMPTSHQAMLISTKVAKQMKFNSNYKVAADYEFFLKRYRLNKQCVFVEDCVVTRVLPGGYSEANLTVMKKEYQKIIFENLGIRKAIIYYFWSHDYLFRMIKSMLPVAVFNKLKSLH